MTINTVPYLQQEYENQKMLFESQPAIIQRFLEGQAQFIAEAFITNVGRVRFALPDRVVTEYSQNGKEMIVTIPVTERQIRVGGFLGNHVREALIHRLNELEKSANQGIAISAGLSRYATAMYMVQDLLPAGAP